MLNGWVRKALFAALLCGSALPADAALPVQNRDQSQIDRPQIYLGDVFSGIPAMDDVAIATAPNPGRSVTYDYNVLSKLAQRYSLEWQADSYNSQTVLTRASSRISTAMVREAILAQVRAQGGTGELDVALDQRALTIDLPTAVKPDFTLHDFSYDKGSQRFHAELLAAADTPAFQQIALTGRVSSILDVPVLNKALGQGAVIGKADLDWVKLPAERAADYLRNANDLVGMELRRQMPEQTALRPQDLLPARVVLRGQLVAMQINLPSMQLTAQGRALQDGAVGDVIRVTNTQSNRVVEAKVAGAGIVIIGGTAKLASLP
ncbi:MAG: flagellar basal body P-ring formation protein FlgA [Alphaproteobacteria bacterium]|nr:flagellar basal body P-ring formation protein FlgA [Alphaproteobacteria bacterium]